MKRMLILAMMITGLLGCAPTHTLKEVIHDPSLLMPTNASLGDNPIMAADQWIRKNLW